jgi:hypothetical protein
MTRQFAKASSTEPLQLHHGRADLGNRLILVYSAGPRLLVWNKAYREGTTGKSIGKQITGYTTLKEDTGEPLGFGMGFVRLLLLWVDFAICYIGVLWPLWDAKRQCLLSDKVTGAVVYKD